MLGGLTFLVVAAIPIVQTKTTLDEDMLLYWRRSEPSECQPFTTYMVECNKCVCSADGTAFCTRMNCFTKDDLQRKGKREERKITARAMFPFSSKKAKEKPIATFIYDLMDLSHADRENTDK